MTGNGVFRVTALPTEPMPTLDGRLLGDKASLLAELGRALRFPDYYGGNWDALEECLADLSWHRGPLRLLITHAEAIPDDLRANLSDIFAAAARQWAVENRPFALYLADVKA
jgi:RNAse (barnase) inhibitor barstar